MIIREHVYTRAIMVSAIGALNGSTLGIRYNVHAPHAPRVSMWCVSLPPYVVCTHARVRDAVNGHLGGVLDAIATTM